MNNSTNATTATLMTSSGEASQWYFIAVHVTSSLSFTVGFPTNLVIVWLVSKRRHLKNPTNAFVSSLALADVLVLIWMMTWIIFSNALTNTRLLQKYITASLDMFLASASMINVACVSGDRAIAVLYPLNYEAVITKRRALYVITAVWLYAFTLLTASLLRIAAQSVTYDYVILCGGFISFFGPVTVVVVAYLVILIVIVHKLKGMRGIERTLLQVQQAGTRKLLRELKVTANILLIVLPFTLGWTFVVGTHLHEAVTRVSNPDYALNLAIVLTPWLLSALNPIVYLMLNRSLRITFFDAVKKFVKSDPYSLEESRMTFLMTISRRASGAFRRPSDNPTDEATRRTSKETPLHDVDKNEAPLKLYKS